MTVIRGMMLILKAHTTRPPSLGKCHWPDAGPDHALGDDDADGADRNTAVHREVERGAAVELVLAPKRLRRCVDGNGYRVTRVVWNRSERSDAMACGVVLFARKKCEQHF